MNNLRISLSITPDSTYYIFDALIKPKTSDLMHFGGRDSRSKPAEGAPMSHTSVESDSLGSRIAFAALKVGGKRKLAQLTGISEIQVFRYISGASSPKWETMVAISGAAHISLEWLAHGKEAPNIIDTLSIKKEEVRSENFRRLIAVCDTDNPIEEAETYSAVTFHPDFIRNSCGLAADQVLLAFMSEDSMRPTLPKGSIAFVETKPELPLKDGIYAFYFYHILHVRRIQRLPGGMFRVMCDNPNFPHFESDLRADVIMIGPVFSYWTAL